MNLGSIAYLGLCAGALIWGGVADKVGRRHCLLICLSMSAFFSVLSAFSQGMHKTQPVLTRLNRFEHVC